MSTTKFYLVAKVEFATEASPLDIGEPAVGNLGQSTTSDLSRCNLERVETIPAIWLLKKHGCGDVRAELVGCC